ncbi:hypothetical protein DLAC_04710 [Tieghemostelium lacteum]|uniref:MRH domain-containing protein n=1 Tax=Tieghemostelium lacteum TaxID=361077 RepID=A0A151ZK95_TIELA|nr:hypothetical protein DLAC_04710 [Tieghemostelium lacteum]|eukprot:KYQ94412.1 hypothetical protein DLAC_04710 [Tieghemostelium lacteum]
MSKSIITVVTVLSLFIGMISCQTSLSSCSFVADGYSYNFTSFGSYNPSGYFWSFGYEQGMINVCQTAYGCASWDGSTGMAACKYSESLAQVSSGQFSSLSPAGSGAYVTYFDNSYLQRVVKVKLSCAPNRSVPALTSAGVSPTNSNQYEFTLSGPSACGTAL